MKRYMLLATGGTIASVESGNGLRPGMGAQALLDAVTLPDHIRVDGRDVFSLDSSNIQPEEWRVLAGEAYRALQTYDGVVITHGTDTMAYTASALSFMLPDLGKPVVLTGSQLPMGHPLSDAAVNFMEALAVTLITCCAIPVLVILFFVWLVKLVLGLDLRRKNEKTT